MLNNGTIVKFNSPIIFFSGAGGIMRPMRKYFPTKRSCNPKKSLKRRSVLNCFALNFGMLVCVETLSNEINKIKYSAI